MSNISAIAQVHSARWNLKKAEHYKSIVGLGLTLLSEYGNAKWKIVCNCLVSFRWQNASVKYTSKQSNCDINCSWDM